MKKRDDKSGLSESFVTGTIAIVFLLVGYQTALFIHRASVMKIIANRDEPDTLFVSGSMADSQDESVDSHYEVGQTSDDGRGRGGTGDFIVLERKNAEHSPRAESIRNNAPRKAAESFSFNPNTVSIEDLCRLGFTPKQAQSIDNYRQKGGRFRRKSDFARSYVVSDSIFNRLEPYIDIPLTDLNLADSSALDALPGIGGWFASRIIEYRNALGGYSYKEQLLDIPRMDEDKYKALEDLVTVSAEHQTSYPLWSLSVDSLRHHPYIGNVETARAIVLFRENSPKESWTVDALGKAGILSHDNVMRLSQCLITAPE